jgi:hypothetical protein
MMIDSESADRTANNGVRHQYRQLSDNEKIDMVAIKDAGAIFLARLDTVASHYPKGEAPGRELALAKTKIEEAVMWAVKGITA